MQNHSTTHSELTLEEVKGKFTLWRTTRKKREKIPDALWSLIKPLIHQHKMTEILKTLQLNSSQLKKKSGIFSVNKKFKKIPTFIECALPEPTPVFTNCKLEFVDKNGSTIRITGLDAAILQPLISQLL